MKRYNHLIPQIIEIDNLYLAYWKARKGKEGKAEVRRFSQSLNKNILMLQEMIKCGKNEHFEYNRFTIYDPKEREICAAPFMQRVLHHALMNVCGDLFDKRQIHDSYACRKGKGTYAAIDRAMNLHRKYDWCIKMDIRKYFDSIDHLVLKSQLASMFKERELLMLFYDIIDSYSTSQGKGLPIGNLTSQYFANQYLCRLDHYAQETLKVKGLVRYMDDVLIYGNDKSLLMKQAKEIRSYLEEHLYLQLKVLDIRKTTQTTPFLGYRLKRNMLLLGKRSKRRYKEKMMDFVEKFESNVWTEDDYRRHLSPVIAFVMKAQCLVFRKTIMEKVKCKRNFLKRAALTA